MYRRCVCAGCGECSKFLGEGIASIGERTDCGAQTASICHISILYWSQYCHFQDTKNVIIT